ncbi:MAG TPA: hypothetical protein PKI14_18095, partial [Fervidobacterium sp.]|nr:hypothetical protein [Fervidobacterium sp.]
QVSVTAKGLTATNIINNGNFANGTSGWQGTNATISVSNNIMQVVPDGSAYVGWLVQNTSYSIFPSRKYFIKAKLRVTNNDCDRMRVWIRSTGGSGDSSYTITAPVANQWYSLAIILDSQATHAGNFRLLFAHEYADAATANGKIMEVQEVMVIDLITHGLENKTYEELNQMFPHWFDGTKSTVGAQRIKIVGKNLFDPSKLENFDIANNSFPTAPTANRYILLPKLKVGSTYTVSMLRSWTANTELDSMHVDVQGQKPDGSWAWVAGTSVPTDYSATDRFLWVRFLVDGTKLAYRLDINKPTVAGSVIRNLQLEEGSQATPYEPYTESTQYLPNVGELRSLPNGVKDEVSVSDGKKEQNISNNIVLNKDVSIYEASTLSNVKLFRTDTFTDNKTWGKVSAGSLAVLHGFEGTSGEASVINNVDNIGKYATSPANQWLWLVMGLNATLEDAINVFGGATLNYQLAEPIITPVQVSGTLVSYPSGTVYIERVVPDAGLYTDKMTVLHQDLPIKALEKLSKIDFMTGLETELDV